MNNEQIKITYCAQTLVFEKEAYDDFQEYEKGLKDFFLKQEDGQEIFDDLQLRICEMLQMRMKASGGVINQADVNFLQTSIGHTNQLEEEELDSEPQTGDSTMASKQTSFDGDFSKKLYRDNLGKMLGGVSSGLGNYFSIDPLAFRLLFILTTIITNGFGLIAYLILWVVLKPKDLEPNYSKRLFRNPNDKIIAGVCGGIATFFKTEAWIIRIIFLSPLILNGVFDGLLDWDISIFNGSALGLSVLSYVILWITTTEVLTPTDNLLAKGEKVTIDSVTETVRASHANPNSNSAFLNILRIFAFILIGIIVLSLFFLLLGLAFGSVIAYPLVSAVLDTQLLKWLGWLSITFFILLPIIAVIVWSIRRMIGAKGPNKGLRLTFGSLWALGLGAAITLVVMLASQNDRSKYVEQRIDLPVSGDTLFVKDLETDFLPAKNTGTNFIFQDLYSEDEKSRQSNWVNFRQEPSPNDSFYAKVRIETFGSTKGLDEKNLGEFRTAFSDNTFYISKYVRIPKDLPYRFQHATVTVYVPKGKVLYSKKNRKNVVINKKGIYINSSDNEDWDIEEESDQEDIEMELDDIEQIAEDAKKEAKEATRKAKMQIKIERQRLKAEKKRIKLEALENELNLDTDQDNIE